MDKKRYFLENAWLTMNVYFNLFYYSGLSRKSNLGNNFFESNMHELLSSTRKVQRISLNNKNS